MTLPPDTVERLFAAAEDLVRETGLSAVTLSAVAVRADVPMDKVAPYFADDRSLRHRLVERYHEANREVLRFSLRNMESVEDAIAQLQQAVHNYFEMFHQDAVLRDVWTEILTDRDMRQINLGHVVIKAADVVELIRPLVPNLPELEVVAVVELMIHMTDVAARWAAMRQPAQARAMLVEFNNIIGLIGADLVRRNEAAGVIRRPQAVSHS
ncbi:hypothetical protein [Zavarzinia sp.]|uniref:hypothetical protein n=1 Tax=Zavarzinia sp. TaxID=2027920 RepID=UPI0035671D8C